MQGAFIRSSVGPGAFGRMSAGPSEDRAKAQANTIAGGPANWANPTGRVSVQFGPGAVSQLLILVQWQCLCCRLWTADSVLLMDLRNRR